MKCFIKTLFAISLILSFHSCSLKDDDYSGYLFAYFLGNGPGQEAVHFAISHDGYNWVALNRNQPVIAADTISSRGGVRDPHILRGADDRFYMVLTDLYVPNDGWTNTGMVLLRSDDLITWTSSKVIIPDLFNEFSDVTRVWAPQTFYDEEADKYMVYFSMLKPGGSDIIYYSYSNDDFTSLATEPEQLFYHPDNKSCIDGDIVYKDSIFHLFFKTEGHGNGIKKASSYRLTEGYVMHDEYLQQTTDAVEGSCVFRLKNSNEFILMYDVYMRGRYQFTKSADLENFRIIDQEITMNFHPRHGTIIAVTESEMKLLINRWGSIEDFGITTIGSESVKRINSVFDKTKNTIYLPVKHGTDLTNLDPRFSSYFKADIRPRGSQDFTEGPVRYTVRLKGTGEKSWEVSASSDNNPILEGYYADPEIIYSENTGKYYLYPTSDGYPNWGGSSFKTFSSTDLVNWTDEGLILDLPKDVSWGTRNAWAPTAAERVIDGQYRYFYYFTAAQKIGVAVSDSPVGPFNDTGKPLINWKPDGITRGQEIDPDVFRDPVSGKDYFYWGNGYLAGAELNPGMVSLDLSTLKVMTPADGTFREGIEVFYRKGIYYFLWSENDTRDEDYRVRYAMSDSPMGEFTIPENNLILAKDPSQGIFGTGHNSVLQLPGTDTWRIIYHRFTRPEGITMGRRAGFHREVCIDKMEFNPDGTIIPVKPTLSGIGSVSSSK
jgi:arabinoxylan arabinofuranohydrolase